MRNYKERLTKLEYRLSNLVSTGKSENAKEQLLKKLDAMQARLTEENKNLETAEMPYNADCLQAILMKIIKGYRIKEKQNQ